jgi:hypothetical protein
MMSWCGVQVHEEFRFQFNSFLLNGNRFCQEINMIHVGQCVMESLERRNRHKLFENEVNKSNHLMLVILHLIRPMVRERYK